MKNEDAIFTWDCSADGAVGHGIGVFLEEKEGAGPCFLVKFVKPGVVYECDCDSAGMLLRLCIDRYANWCVDTDDFDMALFAGTLADKVLRATEAEHDKRYGFE